MNAVFYSNTIVDTTEIDITTIMSVCIDPYGHRIPQKVGPKAIAVLSVRNSKGGPVFLEHLP